MNAVWNWLLWWFWSYVGICLWLLPIVLWMFAMNLRDIDEVNMTFDGAYVTESPHDSLRDGL